MGTVGWWVAGLPILIPNPCAVVLALGILTDCMFQDIILPIARNVCDYIGIVMESAKKMLPP
jgi:hypothetical protein